MDNEDRDKNLEPTEEVNNMPSSIKKKPLDLSSALKKISSKAQILTGPKGAIKLNPKDQSHRDWYNDGK